MEGHMYIALARDETTHDDIVFGVRAVSPAHARQLIQRFYREQEWEGLPTFIQVELFRSNAKDPIFFLGHAHHEYLKREEQVKQLCEKLLEVARSYEIDTGADMTSEIRAFVRDFEGSGQDE